MQSLAQKWGIPILVEADLILPADCPMHSCFLEPSRLCAAAFRCGEEAFRGSRILPDFTSAGLLTDGHEGGEIFDPVWLNAFHQPFHHVRLDLEHTLGLAGADHAERFFVVWFDMVVEPFKVLAKRRQRCFEHVQVLQTQDIILAKLL